ncbi:hypothetical protein [Entomobacter blattae]|uniref:hypothetical protein n=1 Tax=Entomobacter blattae TaxID=2762277 RepID=UPI00193AEA14|nr:hypothetical protein [Entomobacter blattae]
MTAPYLLKRPSLLPMTRTSHPFYRKTVIARLLSQSLLPQDCYHRTVTRDDYRKLGPLLP